MSFVGVDLVNSVSIPSRGSGKGDGNEDLMTHDFTESFNPLSGKW